jgi:hypothetical protein
VGSTWRSTNERAREGWKPGAARRLDGFVRRC